MGSHAFGFDREMARRSNHPVHSCTRLPPVLAPKPRAQCLFLIAHPDQLKNTVELEFAIANQKSYWYIPLTLEYMGVGG